MKEIVVKPKIVGTHMGKYYASINLNHGTFLAGPLTTKPTMRKATAVMQIERICEHFGWTYEKIVNGKL